MADDNLPRDFDENKVYFFRGSTLNELVATIRRNEPKATIGGGLAVDEQTDEGTFLGLDETT